MKNVFWGLMFLVAVTASAGTLEKKAADFLNARSQLAEKIIEADEKGIDIAAAKMKQELSQLKMSRKKCSVCKGEKPFIVKEPDKGQNDGQISKSKMQGEHRVVCPVCRGRGFLNVCNDTEDVARAIKNAERKMLVKSNALGIVFTNNVFLSKQIVGKMTSDTEELILMTLGEPCKKCYYLGVENCRKCKGESAVRCRNSGCRKGWFIRKDRRSTSKTKRPPIVTKCGECRGTGEILCEECEGENKRACRSCGGDGVLYRKRRR